MVNRLTPNRCSARRLSEIARRMNESLLPEAKQILLTAYHKEASATHPETIEAKRRQFVAEFPPEQLGKLRGKELLEFVHGPQAASGLLYQLEFGELGKGLGSIAGGSALKYRVYRAQTGEWKRKGAGAVPVACSELDAIRITEQLADQLYSGFLWADELHLGVGEYHLGNSSPSGYRPCRSFRGKSARISPH